MPDAHVIYVLMLNNAIGSIHSKKQNEISDFLVKLLQDIICDYLFCFVLPFYKYTTMTQNRLCL
jgi:hypothetical protein